MNCCNVCLEIAYNGPYFNGSALVNSSNNTVEEHILTAAIQTGCLECFGISKALQLTAENKFSIAKRVRLSRGGRTDKGVSAVGNTVSLFLNAKNKAGKKENRYLTVAEYDALDFQSINSKDFSFLISDNETEKENEIIGTIAYDKLLNEWLRSRNVPLYIKAFSLVSVNFDARHSALEREYIYYFTRSSFQNFSSDLMLMERANNIAKLLVGTHDFFNFSLQEKDLASVTNTVRTVSCSEFFQCAPNDDNMYIGYKIRATAFLYHQIRCIASVLRLIINGMEDELIISKMFDLKSCYERPKYPLAPSELLVFSRVIYPKGSVHFISTSDSDNGDSIALAMSFIRSSLFLPKNTHIEKNLLSEGHKEMQKSCLRWEYCKNRITDQLKEGVGAKIKNNSPIRNKENLEEKLRKKFNVSNTRRIKKFKRIN